MRHVYREAMTEIDKGCMVCEILVNKVLLIYQLEYLVRKLEMKNVQKYAYIQYSWHLKSTCSEHAKNRYTTTLCC